MKFELTKRKFPWMLVLSTAFLVIFGAVMIYSASFYSAQKDYNDSFYYVKRQLIGCVLGLCGLIFMSFFDYNKLLKFRYLALVVSVILLSLVFVPGVGVENYGAKRWIKLLPGFSPQPSEIAKFGFIIFCAGYMSKNIERMSKIGGVIPPLLAGGSICLLILLEPNLSITICVGLVMLIMLLVGGMRIKHFLLLLIPIALMVPILIIAEPYRLKRLSAFLDPWASPLGEGYQLIQSLYALGSGGLFGSGLFQSRQKLDFLPFAESDFIFSIVGEELGFVGAALVVLVYLVLIVAGIKIALNAKNRFGCYLSLGIVAIIAVQVGINIAVVTGSIPPTGLPLPFISYGSTAQFVFMSGIGILISVHRQSGVTKTVYNP